MCIHNRPLRDPWTVNIWCLVARLGWTFIKTVNPAFLKAQQKHHESGTASSKRVRKSSHKNSTRGHKRKKGPKKPRPGQRKSERLRKRAKDEQELDKLRSLGECVKEDFPPGFFDLDENTPRPALTRVQRMEANNIQVYPGCEKTELFKRRYKKEHPEVSRAAETNLVERGHRLVGAADLDHVKVRPVATAAFIRTLRGRVIDVVPAAFAAEDVVDLLAADVAALVDADGQRGHVGQVSALSPDIGWRVTVRELEQVGQKRSIAMAMTRPSVAAEGGETGLGSEAPAFGQLASVRAIHPTYPSTTANMSKDPKAPEEPQDDQGATPKELLLEACRRNNLELLHEVLEGPACTPDFLNESRNSLGETALHIAVNYGNYEILDTLLDQEGLEVDPETVRDADTPLHFAARYTVTDGEVGAHMVELLVDAGADPRLKNRGLQKPMDLVDPACPDVREALRNAELTIIVQADLAREAAAQHADANDADEAGSGPASDSE
ncbi:hypothetical protein Dda_6411 [Drechslerella dactyloides]|uniref:Uncharacterized protein n=1 Tax=Drechslerella dactyloides TaxID=74499 RepID=A0AAD6NG68_DREDA|nr:hypothetical protein Dda_6411 [Drechslerella dactyloides]